MMPRPLARVTLLVSSLAGFALLAACSTGPRTLPAQPLGKVDLRELILPQLPDWAQDPLAQGYFLDIDRAMAAEKLSRLQAVETQNRFRDYLVDEKNSIQESYDYALGEVRARKVESGWQPVELASDGDFILVIDSVLAQSLQGGKLVERLRRNKSLKGVVVWTTEEDAKAVEALRSLPFRVDGVFTRNHLTMGRSSPRLTKDLRIFDPELKHVVAIDADPSRVLQQNLVRATPQALAGGFSPIAEEIEESSRAAARMKIPFAQAFKPYSHLHEAEFRALIRSYGGSKAKALNEARGSGSP